MGRGPREKLQALGNSLRLSNRPFSQSQKDSETVQTLGKRLLSTHSTGHRMHSPLYSCTNARRSLLPHFREAAIEASGDSILSPRTGSK